MNFTFDSLTKLISKPLDNRIVHPLPKGKKDIMFLDGPAIYPLLREAFGDDFDIKYSEPVTKTYAPVKFASGDIYTPEQVTEVKCTIVVHKPDGRDIIREGFGAATMNAGKGSEENVAKSAQTDAVKKTAMSFGIGLELSVRKQPDAYEWYQETVFGKWTKAAMDRCKDFLAVTNSYMEKLGLAKNLNSLNTLGHYAFGKPTKVTPSNIEEVVNQLAVKQAAQQQEKKVA